MKQLLAAACVAVLLAACASGPKVYESGSSVPTNVGATLSPGTSTVEDAIQAFGEPASRTSSASGTVLGYVRFVTEIASPYRVDSKTRSDTVLLYFNPAGRYLRSTESSGANELRSR